MSWSLPLLSRELWQLGVGLYDDLLLLLSVQGHDGPPVVLPEDQPVQYSTVSTVQYSTVQCSVQYSTVQYNTVQYSTVQYSTVQYSTVQYSTRWN